jgi:hypothetical protein
LDFSITKIDQLSLKLTNFATEPFFLVPFVFAIDLESGRINNYDTTWFLRLGQDMPGKDNAALGNATEVGSVANIHKV